MYAIRWRTVGFGSGRDACGGMGGWSLPDPYPEVLRELLRAGASTADVDGLLEEMIQAEILIRQLTDEREWAWLEQDEALRELNTARSRIRYLERHLRAVGEFPVGEADEEDLEPESCRDVVKYA